MNEVLVRATVWMHFDNMVSERHHKQKATHTWNDSIHVTISQIQEVDCLLLEPEGSKMGPDKLEVTADWYGIYFWSHENVPKL